MLFTYISMLLVTLLYEPLTLYVFDNISVSAINFKAKKLHFLLIRKQIHK